MLTQMFRHGHNGLEIVFGVFDKKAKKHGWKPL